MQRTFDTPGKVRVVVENDVGLVVITAREAATTEVTLEADSGGSEELVEGAGRPFQMSRQELVRLAQELLASLDQRHRRIVEMTLFGGYTAEEIAKSSGETASAVRHILYRSLGRLHAILAKNEKERRTSEAAKEGAYIVSPRTL